MITSCAYIFSTQASTVKLEISLINDKEQISNIKQIGTRYGTIINIL